MTTPQASPARNPYKASTRHHLVDERFAAILAEDLGIARDVILAALEGEPQKQAIQILSWAERTAERSYALRCWARRHGRGRYRVPREGPPGRYEDRCGRRQGYGGHGPAACSLRAVLVDMDALDRIAARLGIT